MLKTGDCIKRLKSGYRKRELMVVMAQHPKKMFSCAQCMIPTVNHFCSGKVLAETYFLNILSGIILARLYDPDLKASLWNARHTHQNLTTG